MSDPFDTDYVGLTSPAVSHFLVVPSDTVDLQVRPRAMFVNTAGTAVLQINGGDAVSYDLPAGTILALRPTRVLATGTTAQLIAWY